jgi:hypothetical protein
MVLTVLVNIMIIQTILNVVFSATTKNEQDPDKKA